MAGKLSCKGYSYAKRSDQTLFLRTPPRVQNKKRVDSHDTSFTEYDDMVIRRVVECIKAYKDGTIKVITKFGTETTETV